MRIVNLAHGDFLMLGGFLRLLAVQSVRASIRCRRCRSRCSLFLMAGLPLYYLLVPRLLHGARSGDALDHPVLRLLAGDRGARHHRLRHQRALDPRHRAGRPVAAVESGSPDGGQPGPVTLFGQSLPAAWVVSAHRQRPGRAADLSLSLSHAPRLSHARGDGAARGGARAAASTSIASPPSPSASASRLPAIAGVFAPFMLGSVTPAMGVDMTIVSFAVIVIGSLGNPLGTVLGGVALRHLLHADAELFQLLGQSAALSPAHRHSAGAAERASRPAGAPCLGGGATRC